MTDRTRRVQVRVSEDIGRRLDAIAQEMGINSATIASVALSEFIIKKEREKHQIENITKSASDFFDLDSNEAMKTIMEKIMK